MIEEHLNLGINCLANGTIEFEPHSDQEEHEQLQSLKFMYNKQLVGVKPYKCQKTDEIVAKFCKYELHQDLVSCSVEMSFNCRVGGLNQNKDFIYAILIHFMKKKLQDKNFAAVIKEYALQNQLSSFRYALTSSAVGGLVNEILAVSSFPGGHSLKNSVHSVNRSDGKHVKEVNLLNGKCVLYLSSTQITVINTFYGQLKVSLVCSVCIHTFVKYYSFGTLLVLLSHTNQIQFSVIYALSDCRNPTRYLVILCKVTYVSDLKACFCNLTGIYVELNNVTVEDGYMAKFLNHATKNMYAFQLKKQLPSAQDDLDSESVGISNKEACATGENSLWRQHNVCLDEMYQTGLTTHNSCDDCLLSGN